MGKVHGDASSVPLSKGEFLGVCNDSFGPQDRAYTDVLWGENPQCDNRHGKIGTAAGLLVLSTHTNAHLIKIQKKSLDLFLTEPFEYVVYDDSYDHAHKSNWDIPGMPGLIEAAVLEARGRYKRIPQHFHRDRRCLFPNTTEPFVNNPNTRCSDVYQFILRDSEIYCSRRVVLLLDADVLLAAPVSPTASLRSRNASAASVKQHRAYHTDGISMNMTYMWTAVNAFDMAVLPGRQAINWDCGNFVLMKGTPTEKVISLDSGGHTFEWLTQYSPHMFWLQAQTTADSIDEDWQWLSQNWAKIYRDNKLYDLEFKSQILGDMFLHLRNGGNWMSHGKRYKFIQPAQAEVLSQFLQRRKAKLG